MALEQEPNYDKVVFIDEYPHLEEKLRLQRLSRPALRATLHDMTKILVFDKPEIPDEPA